MPQKSMKALVLLIGLLTPALNAHNQLLRAHQRKHDTKVESWSLAVRLHHKQDTVHAVAFFVSGKVFFMSGNFFYSSVYTSAEDIYQSKAKALLPPFQTVRHNREELDERFGSNRITLNKTNNSMEIGMKLPLGRLNLSAPLQKHTIWFKDIFTKSHSEKRFNWYLHSLSDISAKIENRNGTYTGNGYFQHFWGEGGDQHADWMVAQLDDGTMLIGAHFCPETAAKPWLPYDYLLRISPDGTKRIQNDITVTVVQSFEGKKGTYPTSFVLKTSDGDRVAFDAFKINQTAKIANREAWNGFGTVEVEIDGKRSKGWAYYSPFARE